jgi:hypothetical protein
MNDMELTKVKLIACGIATAILSAWLRVAEGEISTGIGKAATVEVLFREIVEADSNYSKNPLLEETIRRQGESRERMTDGSRVLHWSALATAALTMLLTFGCWNWAGASGIMGLIVFSSGALLFLLILIMVY